MTREKKSNATLACEMNAINFLNQATEHSMQEFKLEIDTINGEDFYNISVDGDRLLEGSVKGLNLIQVTAFALRNYVIRHTNQIPFDMTREEQLQATAQPDVVAHHRKTYEHNIDQAVEKLKLELLGALGYENLLRHNPYYTDENTSLRNSEALNDIYKAVVNLPLVYFEYSDGQYGVDLEKEGY